MQDGRTCSLHLHLPTPAPSPPTPRLQKGESPDSQKKSRRGVTRQYSR